MKRCWEVRADLLCAKSPVHTSEANLDELLQFKDYVLENNRLFEFG